MQSLDFYRIVTELTFREALSGIAGSISLVSWIFLLIPQLLENYRRGSAEAVSLLFICIWLVGDIANVVGAVWAGLVPTIIAVSVYFCVSDTVLIAQCVYYNTINAAADRRLQQAGPEQAATETDALMPKISNTSATTPIRDRRRSSTGSQLHPVPRSVAQEWIKNTLSVGFIIGAGIGGWAIAYKTGAWRPTPIDSTHDDTPWGAEVLGYIGAFLFLGARTPQIVKNYRAKSCEGFAILFPVIATIGNLTYAAGILFHSLEDTYLVKNLPWLIGSLGTIVGDAIILGQFLAYRSAETITTA